MPFDGYQRRFGDIDRLLDARSRIADPGHWIKGTFRRDDRYCTVGALREACPSDNARAANRVECRLAKLLAEQLPSGRRMQWRMMFRPARCALISFNDHPETRHADILALFDGAIARLEAAMSVSAHAV